MNAVRDARHAPIDARSRPALSRSAGCVKTTTLEALVARSGLAAIAFVTMLCLATAALMRRGTRCSVSGV
ncbi:MAG: hypothetical protein E6G75_22130 [Alphaproteobacteria bacterium]|nr:MAG: hypothetical protein E6G75_22130 [Alphaproteobacteria bacterium]